MAIRTELGLRSCATWHEVSGMGVAAGPIALANLLEDLAGGTAFDG